MSKGRVKYFNKSDWAYGHHIDKIESMEIPDFSEININDAIEFFEIHKYFADGIKADSWNEEEYSNYIEKSRNLFSLSMRFFNSLNDNNVVEEYANVDIDYKKIFWQIFDKCNLQNKISAEAFKTLIESEKCNPFHFMKYNNSVKKYDTTLREYLLSSAYSTDVIVNFYEQSFTNKTKLVRPESFTGEDIANCISSYIDKETVSPNLLEAIIGMQYSNDFPITDEIRLRAKRRLKVINDEKRNPFWSRIAINHFTQSR